MGCLICGADAVAVVSDITLGGYTDGDADYTFSSRVDFQKMSETRPGTCDQHRREVIVRLVKRVAPRPLAAFRVLNWSAELTDRTRQEGRFHRVDPPPTKPPTKRKGRLPPGKRKR